MKKALIFIGLLLIVCAALAQTVNIRGSKMILQYGANNYSVELKGDSVLIDASDFMWFADKIGSDTLLFGDGTYMTTAFVSGVNDTGYVKTTGDTMTGYYYINHPNPTTDKFYFESTSDAYMYICRDTVFQHSTLQAIGGQHTNFETKIYPGYISLGSIWNETSLRFDAYHPEGGYTADSIVDDIDLIIKAANLYLTAPTTAVSGDLSVSGTINGLYCQSDNTTLADDASIAFTAASFGWGEVYVFNSGAVAEWAEFMFNSDGTVTLKTNSTNVVNTDTDNKFCIYDAGAYFAIRNRLGGSRTVKYIIHH